MADIAARIDQLFAEWDRPDSPGCALGVIQEGQLVYARGYGMADLEREVPITPASVFDIGSTGKQFTAMIIAILADQGRLSLDDPIQQHLPEMPDYEQPITLRHLLHHTSGLRDYTDLMGLADMPTENTYPEEQLFDLIARQQGLNFRPGQAYLYSNSGYFLLGVIVRRVTGTSLLELIQEHILQPLGMRHTSFNDDYGQVVKGRALSYAPREGGGYRNELSLCGGFGDGPILSSVEDLFLWDQNFYRNRLGGGGPELLRHMLTPARLNNGQPLGYALGLWLDRYRGRATVSHGGGWAGYRSELVRFPEQSFSVVCLANLSSMAPTRLARQVADIYLAPHLEGAGLAPHLPPGTPTEGAGLADALTGEETRPPQSFVLTRQEMERRAGFYRSVETGHLWELSIREGKLTARAFDDSFELEATGPTRLRAVDAPVEVEVEFREPLSMRVEREDSPPEWYRKLETIPPASLADYVGDYTSAELKVTYSITHAEGGLWLRRGYAPRQALKPVSGDIFIARGLHEWGSLELEFARDERGTLDVSAEGARHLRFTR